METSANVSTPSSRMRGHDSHPRKVRSHKLPSSTNERYWSSTPSNVPEVLDTSDAEELRRARAEYYSASSEEHRRNAHKKMASDHSRRRELGSRVSSLRDSNKGAREVRESHGSEHRRRRRKPHDSDGGGNESIVYVYKSMGISISKGVPRSAPRLRRTGETVARSRTEFEEERGVDTDGIRPNRSRRSSDAERQKTPQRTVERPVSRTTSRRTRSYYPDQEKTPLRTEERPTSRMATRSRAGATVNRYASMRETASVPIARPPLTRSQTTSRRVRQSSSSVPAPPSVNVEVKRAPSIARTNDNSSGFFGSLHFSSSKPARPERQIECLTCLSSDIPISKSAKLSCDHRMCNTCLRRIFTLSVTDPQHMPPKCCTQDHIPLKHVEKLFDTKFKVKWNQKYQEYTTKNRIYCPARGCGEWIKPANIHLDTSGGANGGRKYGKCGRCRTKVCCTCNGKWHARRECPKDEATQRFAEIAKEEGWQRCFNCSATVELKEGCNHMTCRCRAEFCMVCGLKWKTCDCPWFNYEAVENDRLNHMNPPQVRRVPVNQQRGYQEELDRRREQERRDEALARRMQVLGIDLQTGNNPQNNNMHHNQDVVELGHAPHHVVNQHFLRRAADLLSSNYNNDQAATAIRMMNDFIPPPPPPVAPERQPPLNVLRHHSTASRQYNNNPRTRASERVVPRRMQTDYGSEAERHRPLEENEGAKVGTGGKRHSTLAGLTRGTTEGRVDEWRRHIGDD